jgi:hypothetical protein
MRLILLVVLSIVIAIAIGLWLILNMIAAKWDIGVLLWIGRFLICMLGGLYSGIIVMGFLAICCQSGNTKITLKLPGLF